MKAVLFDLDGVLIDTEPLKARAHVQTIESLGGNELAPELYKNVLGGSGTVVRNYFMEQGSVRVEHEEYKRHWHPCYEELLAQNDPSRTTTKPLLAKLLNDHYQLGLITSSARTTFEVVASQARWCEHFNVVVTGTDVEQHKPHPEPYAQALKKLGMKPRQAVAVEDSPAGIKSARRAGLAVIKVGHEYNARSSFPPFCREVEGLPVFETWHHIQTICPLP